LPPCEAWLIWISPPFSKNVIRSLIKFETTRSSSPSFNRLPEGQRLPNNQWIFVGCHLHFQRTWSVVQYWANCSSSSSNHTPGRSPNNNNWVWVAVSNKRAPSANLAPCWHWGLWPMAKCDKLDGREPSQWGQHHTGPGCLTWEMVHTFLTLDKFQAVPFFPPVLVLESFFLQKLHAISNIAHSKLGSPSCMERLLVSSCVHAHISNFLSRTLVTRNMQRIRPKFRSRDIRQNQEAALYWLEGSSKQD
jgi:hypothetical protein